ncbi:MAG: class I SAM-dependent methyltransferase [Vicinamibacterales bacterium]
MDIYLLDQLLRGRIDEGHRIMDAGCGGGRNVAYFLQAGFDVTGLDADPQAVAAVRALAARVAPRVAADCFRAETLASSSFPDGCAEVVVSSAVLHFARDDQDFDAMLAGSWRLLAPGGLFFARLASSIGIEQHVRPERAGSRRCRLPDGSDRYLVDEPLLMTRARELGGRLLDPLKTTVVQNQRAMTTWVMERER